MGWDKSTFPRNEALVFIEGNISKLHGTYLDVGINEEVLFLPSWGFWLGFPLSSPLFIIVYNGLRKHIHHEIQSRNYKYVNIYANIIFVSYLICWLYTLVWNCYDSKHKVSRSHSKVFFLLHWNGHKCSKVIHILLSCLTGHERNDLEVPPFHCSAKWWLFYIHVVHAKRKWIPMQTLVVAPWRAENKSRSLVQQMDLSC